MIMTISDPDPLSMSSSPAIIPASDQPRAGVQETSGNGHLLQQRLALVEDLWQTVLRSECPAEQAERLLRMKQLSDPALPEPSAVSSDSVVSLIRDMDLSEAIAAARAFSGNWIWGNAYMAPCTVLQEIPCKQIKSFENFTKKYLVLQEYCSKCLPPALLSLHNLPRLPSLLRQKIQSLVPHPLED